MIPILDSLAHPTLSGNWGRQPQVCTFRQLVTSIEDANFAGACAIGMAGVEGYSHEEFMVECRQYEKLIPIAGYDPATSAAHDELSRLKTLGYRGVKLHPRYSHVTRSLDKLAKVFQAAGQLDLIVFYCTYLHGPLASYPKRDPLYDLVGLLEQAPDTKVILVHGGDVNLLRYAELVRFNENLLLDLSLTLMKYAGSSLDLDLKFLFSKFDRRICIGTDYPEYNHADVRLRFEQLSRELTEEKCENIAFRNLVTLFRWST